MFSLDRFNLSRFSLGNAKNTIAVGATFVESMNSVAGIAIPVPATAFFNTGLRGTSRGSIMVKSAMTLFSELSAACSAYANIIVRSAMTETVSQASAAVKNLVRGAELTDTLMASGYGSKNIPLRETELDMLSANVVGVKNIQAQALVAEILTALAGGIKQATERTTITIALPPGAELRIDSGTFRVLLDGENILYAQSGDWLMLSRELLYLDIESATGGELSGNMIYTERYL